MVKVISFCIFGNNIKYCQGLIDNLEIIKNKLPNFETWIYCGNDVPKDYIEKYSNYKIRLIYPEEQGNKLTSHRIFPIDDPDVDLLFSRDSDSRINERDLYCMNEFINSDKLFHIIRDNVWHRQKRICGGLFGIKKGLIKFNIKEKYLEYFNNGEYGSDEIFFENYIYIYVKDKLLIHSDIISFNDEPYPNEIKIKYDGINFVGNVYEYDKGYIFNGDKQMKDQIIPYIEFLIAQKDWNMVIKGIKNLTIKEFSHEVIHFLLTRLYMGYYYLNDIENARQSLRMFQNCHVDDNIIKNSDFIFNKMKALGYKIIGTTDITRTPKEKEILIIYGNFHHSIDNLPHSNIIKRHAIYYKNIKHDIFESDLCWTDIDKFYILNLEERVDRYMEIMVEFCRMNIPLDKVHHYKAKKEIIIGDKAVDPHLGACKNHIDVVKDFLNSTYENCIIFEDDVTFTSDIDLHKKSLTEFFKRRYEFDVCLGLSSKFWDIEKYDDLLSLSYQICTTTACYILSRSGAQKVLPIFIEGFEMMKLTKNTHTYAVDRYWNKIQKDNKFFLFNNKFGYQRCNYSSITGNNTCHFD